MGVNTLGLFGAVMLAYAAFAHGWGINILSDVLLVGFLIFSFAFGNSSKE